MRNSFTNFYGVGNPNVKPGTYGWLSLVDAALIWPAAACVFYQYSRSFKGKKSASSAAPARRSPRTVKRD